MGINKIYMLLAAIALVGFIGWEATKDAGNSQQKAEKKLSIAAKKNDSLLNFYPYPDYELLSEAFQGKPKAEDIEFHFHNIFENQGLKENYGSVMKIGNELVGFRKRSKKGITEMDVLEYVELKGKRNFKLSQNITLAEIMLEGN